MKVQGTCLAVDVEQKNKNDFGHKEGLSFSIGKPIEEEMKKSDQNDRNAIVVINEKIRDIVRFGDGNFFFRMT